MKTLTLVLAFLLMVCVASSATLHPGSTTQTGSYVGLSPGKETVTAAFLDADSLNLRYRILSGLSDQVFGIGSALIDIPLRDESGDLQLWTDCADSVIYFPYDSTYANDFKPWAGRWVEFWLRDGLIGDDHVLPYFINVNSTAFGIQVATVLDGDSLRYTFKFVQMPRSNASEK